jgi:hypothetical protein
MAMPVTVQSQFASAVAEADMDVFTRSYTEGEGTVIEFDMEKAGLSEGSRDKL